jgi:hypothetical protein
MANTFEVQTMNGSVVTANTAGIDRNRIEREHQVGDLDQDQHEEERRGVAHPLPRHDEALAVVPVGQAQTRPDEGDHAVVLQVRLLVDRAQHLEAAEHQEGAEQVEDPVELVNERGPRHNESGAHRYSAVR